MSSANPPYTTALLAGALAGTAVDLSLYPLDTLKTRLQSASGFAASGGFRRLYRGLGSVLVGSAPAAAAFFATYETSKTLLASSSWSSSSRAPGSSPPVLHHVLAASVAEVAACAVRVPTDVVKQRAQAGQHGGSASAVLAAMLRVRPLAAAFRQLYRGWAVTVARELPFTAVQFPLWEALRVRARRRRPPPDASRRGVDVGAVESGLYGSLAGAVAAALTTPLDVLKTRVMLSARPESAWTVMRDLLASHGIRPFFAGIGPRVVWISAGGAIFLGSYQWAVNTLQGAGGWPL